MKEWVIQRLLVPSFRTSYQDCDSLWSEDPKQRATSRTSGASKLKVPAASLYTNMKHHPPDNVKHGPPQNTTSPVGNMQIECSLLHIADISWNTIGECLPAGASKMAGPPPIPQILTALLWNLQKGTPN